MIYKILFTKTAKKSIDTILEKIDIRYGRSVYNRVKLEIDKGITLIECNPLIGRPFGLYKKFVLGKNIIFYKIEEKKAIIYIMYVFDCRQNWMRLLR